MTDNISTTQTTRRPKSRARSHKAASTQAGNSPNQPGLNAQREQEWNSFNRLSSAFIAGHRDRTLGDVTVLEMLTWAQVYCGMTKPRTLAAGR